MSAEFVSCCLIRRFFRERPFSYHAVSPAFGSFVDNPWTLASPIGVARRVEDAIDATNYSIPLPTASDTPCAANDDRHPESRSVTNARRRPLRPYDTSMSARRT